MSYRGGHPGAVAVSYGASTMSPLSPSRRYSGSTGSGTSVTSGTNSGATSKYTNYRSSTPSNLGNDRNGGYYPSASNTGYRGSSYTSSASSDTFRRTYYSPARSVSSYNESSSIVSGTSSISGSGLRYGSASSSSASSTASSNSSCASRDRSNNLHYHTPGSLAKTAADLYAIYSPTNYVPNIHGSSSKSASNGHWRPSSSSSPSSASSTGISSNSVSELHGSDAFDSCRERRERSYSSESSSGICLSSANSTSSNHNNGLPSSGNNERWTTRREINKRRGTPLIGVSSVDGNLIIDGNARKTEVGSSTIEVTRDPEESSRNSLNHRDVLSSFVTRDTAINDETLPIEDPSSLLVVARNNENRENNNASDKSSKSSLTDLKNANDPDTTEKRDNVTSETRRIRRRVQFEGSKNLSINGETDNVRRNNDDDDDDENGDKKNYDEDRETKNLTLVEPYNRDNSDDNCSSESRAVNKGETREDFRLNDHHHQRKRHSDQSSINDVNNRKNEVNIPNLSSPEANPCNIASPLSPVTFVTSASPISHPRNYSNNLARSVASSVSSLVPGNFEDEQDTRARSSPTTKSRPINLAETVKNGNIKVSNDSYDCGVDNVGGGGGGAGGGGGVVVVVGTVVGSSAVGDADHHRKALTRTKIPTNTDNTELLTNNNLQDREDVLGIVETTRALACNERLGSYDDENSGTRINESKRQIVKGPRKSLFWTATNQIDPDDEVSSEDLITNGDDSKSGITNGFDESLVDHCDPTNSEIDDLNRDDETNETLPLIRNGVRSSVTRNDDTDKASTSRRTVFGWNDPTIDDLTGASSSSTAANASSSSSSSSASSSNATNSVPVAVHQNLYRGINEQIIRLHRTSVKLALDQILNWGLSFAWSVVALFVTFAFFLGIAAPLEPRAKRYKAYDNYQSRASFVYSLSRVNDKNDDSDIVAQNPSALLLKDESSNSRPPRSRLQSRRDERYGLNGLRNIGNTCFMNSVIQCLSNTRPLLEYLLNEQHLHDINTTTSSMKGALIKAFGQVIQELWEMSGDHVINTTALKSQIQRFAPRFMGYSQQDAQEFLRYLLEGLHEDVNRVTVKPQPILTDIPDHYSDSHKASESWKRYLRSEDSTIVDVFVGQLRSSLHCTSCDHVSVTLDPFWDLSLPIPLRLGTVKLNQCLEHFTKVETLDGDEKPTCSKCQMRRKCTKSFSIQKFPKILVIHLKRFSPTERFRGKLSVLVDFPLTCLDLSAFAAPGVQGCTYNLYGVANHSGTTYSGHYTAYCKHPYSGEWHEYNDSRVSSVPGRSVVSSEAYVLFYEQQPPSPHL